VSERRLLTDFNTMRKQLIILSNRTTKRQRPQKYSRRYNSRPD